jgi:hypothetical protein
MRARSLVRAGLIFFGVGDVLLGAFAYLLPHHFYNDVPTVSMDPPFSQHFVSDVGAFYVSQGVVLILAAIVMEVWLARAALAGYATFAVLHLVFHATHLAGMPPHDAIVLVIALALDAAIPLALLIMTGSRAGASARTEVEYGSSGSPRRSHGQTVE